MWSESAISNFLHYGYLPGNKDGHAGLPWAHFTASPLPASRSGLIDLGIDALRESFGRIEDQLHVIPLSGGLDSRAILAEVVRQVGCKNVRTFTFGIPESLDFRIAPVVAEAAGVKHQPFDLNDVCVTSSGLESAAHESSSPTWLMDVYYNRESRLHYGREALFWSGYLGSRVTSARSAESVNDMTWESAASLFHEHNRWGGPSLSLPGQTWRDAIPDTPLHPDSSLHPYQQLDLTIRQERFIKAANVQPEFRHRTPFREPPWIQYTLSLPLSEREEKKAYKDVLRTAFPSLFAIPTTTRSGRGLVTSPWQDAKWYASRFRRRVLGYRRHHLLDANYVDFAAAIRERSDFGELVADSMRCLEALEAVPWLNLEQLLRRHMKREADLSMALTLLISLRFHLEEGTDACPTHAH